MNIATSSPATQIFSTTHKIDKLKTDASTVITLQNGIKHKPNKDFILYFRNDAIQDPVCVLSKSALVKDKYCAMITFVPDFNNDELDDAQQAAMENAKDFDADIENAKGEFIFVLDRSGSMSSRSRIGMAKEAIILFLKSLPPQAFFNIISFGNQYKALYPENQPAIDQCVEDAISKVQRFEADMGGTNIDDALSFCYNMKKLPDTPRLVFLLTDGDVRNPKGTALIALKNNKHCRTFTIGLGSGASPYLVREVAKKGRGKYEFVENGENLAGKVISLLSAAISPVLTNFKFKFDTALVDALIPSG